MTTITISKKIKRETEKAVLLTVGLENGAQYLNRDFWFPKSQIVIKDNTIEIKTWIAEKKIAELDLSFTVWYADAPQCAA